MSESKLDQAVRAKDQPTAMATKSMRALAIKTIAVVRITMIAAVPALTFLWNWRIALQFKNRFKSTLSLHWSVF